MKSPALKISLFFLMIAFASGSTCTTEQSIKVKIQDMFRQTYQVKAAQLHINWRRLPDLSAFNSGYQTEVRLQSHKLKLGYQTLWVNLIKKGRLIKKVPVSLEISIDKQVITASQKIKGHQRITSEMLTKVTRRIASDWSALVTSKQDLIGKEAKRVIREGTIITKDLFRPVPVIHRGDVVKVQVKSTGLTLTTSAYAKEEGTVGETIHIETVTGGRKLKAKIQGPGLVVILQETPL